MAENPQIDPERLIELQNALFLQVHEEFEAQRRFFRGRWAQPLGERLLEGSCIAGLRLDRYLGEQRWCFLYDENDSNLREGDIVRLSEDDPQQPIVTAAVIYEDQPGMLTLSIRSGGERLSEELGQREWVADLDLVDLEGFYRDALEDLTKTALGRDRILPLLLGKVAQKMDAEEVNGLMEDALEDGANDSQAEAIALATAAAACYLVQGPPGTGKTHVLAQVIKHRVARGERVLVTAANHRAINNALAKYAQVRAPGATVARIGPVFHDPQLEAAGVEFRENFHELSFRDSGGAYVIGATPFATRTRRLKGVEFDTIVFDEASQVTVPLAIMGMLAGKTYLFLGDDQQMPPVLHQATNRQARHHSIFARLNGQGFDTMLEVTYRMNAEITRWASEQFYQGRLRPHPRNAERRLRLPQTGDQFDEILDPEKPIVTILTSTSLGRLNLEEADWVLCLLRELVARGLPLSEIGVVVPFRVQARWIRTRLQQDPTFAAHDPRSCVVDTVERMQGQEREVIIGAMTAADPRRIESLWNFLYQPERLNVTVTRAKSKFIWLVSEAFFPEYAEDPDRAEDVARFQSLKQAGYLYMG